MIIGGAEDKLRKRRILQEFVAASGGPEARIAVIPTASSLGDEIVDVYDALFRAEGAAEVTAVRPESREQADDPELVGAAREGHRHLHDRRQPAQAERDHLRDPGRRRHRRGARSAAPSSAVRRPARRIQSSHMLAFGVGGSTPKQRMTQMAAGLGLLPGDRDRPALRAAQPLRAAADDRGPVAAAARAWASTRTPQRSSSDGVLSVVGRGAVTILDPSNITTNAFDAKRSAPLLASGVVLHVLPQGARFDLTTPGAAALRGPGRPARGGRDRGGRPATCARWPATSRPATPPPASLRRRLRRTRKTGRRDPADHDSDQDGDHA